MKPVFSTSWCPEPYPQNIRLFRHLESASYFLCTLLSASALLDLTPPTPVPPAYSMLPSFPNYRRKPFCLPTAGRVEGKRPTRFYGILNVIHQRGLRRLHRRDVWRSAGTSLFSTFQCTGQAQFDQIEFVRWEQSCRESDASLAFVFDGL